MKKATWGWFPPLYQKYDSGKYMIIYNPVEFQKTVKHINHETKEEIEQNITRWNVWYEEMELPQITKELKAGNEEKANRLALIEVINLYDQSPAVNEFTINGVSVWLDKNTRNGLKLRFETELAFGKTETTLWYNKQSFKLPLEKAVQMLYAIELYASECYDVTQKHLSNIDSLETLEDILNYDYRAGYPAKLNF